MPDELDRDFIAIHQTCKIAKMLLHMGHISDYPVHGTNLTAIQPTWSAYPYHLAFPYMVSLSPGFPYMSMLQTFNRKMPLFWMRRC